MTTPAPLSRKKLLAALASALDGTKLTPATPKTPPTPGTKRVGSVENAHVARWALRAPMRPRAKIWYIHHHACEACGAASEFVGQPLVRFENATTGYARELPTAVVEELPVEVIDLPEILTEQCPQCLRLSRRLDDILDAHAISGTPTGTRSLFS